MMKVSAGVILLPQQQQTSVGDHNKQLFCRKTEHFDLLASSCKELKLELNTFMTGSDIPSV